jgi:hypothetical protein
MLKRDVDKRALGVGEKVVTVAELAADLQPATALALELRGDRERAVDVDRL